MYGLEWLGLIELGGCIVVELGRVGLSPGSFGVELDCRGLP